MIKNIKLILISLGLINATFLTYKHLVSLDYCIVGQSCGAVLTSQYSTFLGLPVGLYGVIFFAILLYVFVQNRTNDLFLTKCEVVLLFMGGVVSTGLMLIQFLIIRSFCIYCTLSATIVFLLITLTILKKRGIK